MPSKSKTSRRKKKAKASWRRADIRDVEKFVDEQRRENETKSKSQRTDDDLFLISRKIKQTAKEVGKGENNHSVRFKFVDVNTGIEPIVKPRTNIKSSKKRNPILKAKFKLKDAKLNVIRTTQIKNLVALRKAKSVWTPSTDIWAEEKKIFENEYIAEADDYFKQQTCQKDVTVPTVRYTKPSNLPAVEIPVPGASYMPTTDDYQKLLHTAHEIELNKQRKEKQLDKQLNQMFPTKAEAPTEKDWLREMSQGLNVNCEVEDESDKSEIDDKPLSCNPPTVRKPKVRATRNKEKRIKMVKKKLEKEKLHRKQMNDILKVKSIVAEIKRAELKSEERRVERTEKSRTRKSKIIRLGNVKYEDPEVELLLASEKSRNLRQMRPQGSIFQDRMKSLQRRNIIEPTLRRTFKRKYKLKKYVKKSHRE